MYWFILTKIWHYGASIHRQMFDWHLQHLYLEGNILDLGSGKQDMYSTFIPRSENSKYSLFDNKITEIPTDFETDKLPYKENEFDTVLLFNVLEHIYNYKNVLIEIKRIKSGKLIGSVPFIKWYHADPNDYFRYTHQALEKIFTECGYTKIEIKPLYLGPYCTAFEQIRPTLPRLINPIIFSICYGLDKIFRKLRGKNAKRYVMDYLFICE